MKNKELENFLTAAIFLVVMIAIIADWNGVI